MTVNGEDRDPAKTCNTDGCNAWATKQSDRTRCRNCGGESTGAPEGNQNSVSHGLYAQADNFYQNLDDELRALCDEIFQDYATDYRDLYGNLNTGHQARLFEIAVNQIKIIHANNWLQEKPDTLESGNPIVDRETHYTEDGTEYHRYKESVVIATEQKLRREDRAWLKDMGLLHDPESQKADSVGDLASTILELESE